MAAPDAPIPSERTNPIQAELAALGVIDLASVTEIHPRTRDCDHISVLRCGKSGVIYLSDASVMGGTGYAAREDFGYWSAKSREEAAAACLRDDTRRANEFGGLIEGRRWLDVGTGAGGILDLLASTASVAAAVEPQRAARQALLAAGYVVYSSLANAPAQSFDIVTLFHVLEHLPQQVRTLAAVAAKLVPGGKIIVEVPHARDFLIEFLDHRPFKDFSFWSEHLVLHTRDSLRAVLAAAGFMKVEVSGLQRYPLANHLHWLAKGEPGGHERWAELGSMELDRAYAAMLNSLDMTDTLVAVAQR